MKTRVSTKTIDYLVGAILGLIVCYFGVPHWPEMLAAIRAWLR